MKTFFRNLISIPLLIVVSFCAPSDKDSVKQAHKQNLNASIDEDISNYMTKAADARMMNIEVGKLAKTKGSSESVRSFGEQALTANTKFLHDLRVLAASKNIVLPNFISNKNARDLEDLREQDGEEFDKHFIKMMKNIHKDDIDAFEDATNYQDEDIQKFAPNRLPLLESELESLKNINSKDAVSERADKEVD